MDEDSDSSVCNLFLVPAHPGSGKRAIKQLLIDVAIVSSLIILTVPGFYV